MLLAVVFTFFVQNKSFTAIGIPGNFLLKSGFKSNSLAFFKATSKVSSAKAAIHAANYYKKMYGNIDYIVLFQPTSPFRTKKTILRAINLSKRYSNKQIISVNYKNQKPRRYNCVKLN